MSLGRIGPSPIPGPGALLVHRAPSAVSAPCPVRLAAASPARLPASCVSARPRPQDVDSTPGNGAPGEDDRVAAPISVQRATSDVSLAYDVVNPMPQLGEAFSFGLTVTNQHATQTATNLTVRTGVVPDSLARYAVTLRAVTLRAVTLGGTAVPAGAFNPATGEWTLTALAPGEARTLRFTLSLARAINVRACAEVYTMQERDGDSTPLNGVVTEDDYACATAGIAGATSGEWGGLESNGALAQDLARVFYRRTLRPARPHVQFSPQVPAFAVLGTSGEGERLTALVPEAGPEASQPVVATPADLLGVTNATGVLSVDYVRASDQRRVGAILALATQGGQVYEHTKAVCDRLKTASLSEIDTLVVHGYPFVLNTLVNDDGTIDYAASFIAYEDAGRQIVDSRFLLTQYAVAEGARVTNVQVWSVSRAYTRQLVEDVRRRLGTFTFRTGETALPRVFVERAEYRDGALHLRLNNAASAKTLRLTGCLLYTSPSPRD